MSRFEMSLLHVGDLLGLVGRPEALQESKLPVQRLQDGGYGLGADVQGRPWTAQHISLKEWIGSIAVFPKHVLQRAVAQQQKRSQALSCLCKSTDPWSNRLCHRTM